MNIPVRNKDVTSDDATYRMFAALGGVKRGLFNQLACMSAALKFQQAIWRVCRCYPAGA
jgi:hypothetical protein